MRIIRKQLGRPRKYKPGDKIGQLVFEDYTSNGKGHFECPGCFGFFEARIASVKQGKVKRCKDCREGKC